MKKYYCLLFLIFTLNTFAFAQTERFEKAIKEALSSQQFFTDDDFFGISTKDSLTIDDQFQFSEVARRMYALGIAEVGYRRVVRLDTLKGDEVNYPSAIFQVGAMKKLQGDYAGALDYFEQYITSPPPIDNDYLTLAKKHIDDCKFAVQRTQRIDNQYNVTHLGPEINTEFNDFSPLLVGDKLYYSSLKYEKEEKMDPPRLYAKTLSADFDKQAFPIDGFNVREKSVAHLAFTNNQQRVYFTICDYTGKSRRIRCEIYYQDQQEGSWSEAVALPDYINRNGFTATHPTVFYDAEGQESLLFSSDCPGGMGKMDVWMTKVSEQGDFSKPVNYRPINTAGNDLTPFFHQPTNTLYFSSDGRVGLGGYDIYALSDNKINHAGYPLNSSFNDTHFTLDPAGDHGYFSSSREGCLRLSESDMGCQDIFAATFINIDLEALIFDDFTKEDLEGVTLQLFSLPEGRNFELDETGEPALVDTRTNSLDNQFQFDGLLKDKRYRLVASKEGFVGDTLNFNTRGITQSITLKKELFLAPDIFEMDLTALTFDNQSQLPLTNCIVQLIDVKSGERFIKDNIEGNDFYFDIYSQREYQLIASLIGYTTDTLTFDTKAYTEADGITSITKRLYLEPGGLVELDDLLPLTLYFDNDYPDPRSREITTSSNYEALYSAYYRKKREFIANYTSGVDVAEVASKSDEVVYFFDNELKGNYDTLGVFSETLIKYLQRNNTAVISIRGYASPLAATDYNANLGKRRVDCLMNHFSTYRDGMLLRYIENGSLILKEVSYGEDKANNRISENPRDRKNSVYSPEASRERKVQIVKITIGEQSEGE